MQVLHHLQQGAAGRAASIVVVTVIVIATAPIARRRHVIARRRWRRRVIGAGRRRRIVNWRGRRIIGWRRRGWRRKSKAKGKDGTSIVPVVAIRFGNPSGANGNSSKNYRIDQSLYARHNSRSHDPPPIVRETDDKSHENTAFLGSTFSQWPCPCTSPVPEMPC